MSGKGRVDHDGDAPTRVTITTHNGSGSGSVAGIQRARLLAAMSEVACERGVANVTVAHVVERAGVSRRTFYELFDDREDCLLAALDDAIARVCECVVPAYEAEGRWRERVRAALTAFLAFLDEEPAMGRLLIVESLGAGPIALERRTRVLDRVIAVVDAGRGDGVAGSGLSLTAEGVVGAVLSVIHGRMVGGGRGRPAACTRMGDLVNPLMSMVVLPYLGSAAARAELERPVPKATGRGHVVSANPLKDLDMRLTYRTVRVLGAVAANRGSSNRVIGEASGMRDQGQTSKLLARLERLGLVENTDAGSVHGGPNAWSLTQTGLEVHGALTAQAHS